MLLLVLAGCLSSISNPVPTSWGQWKASGPAAQGDLQIHRMFQTEDRVLVVAFSGPAGAELQTNAGPARWLSVSEGIGLALLPAVAMDVWLQAGGRRTPKTALSSLPPPDWQTRIDRLVLTAPKPGVLRVSNYGTATVIVYVVPPDEDLSSRTLSAVVLPGSWQEIPAPERARIVMATASGAAWRGAAPEASAEIPPPPAGPIFRFARLSVGVEGVWFPAYRADTESDTSVDLIVTTAMLHFEVEEYDAPAIGPWLTVDLGLFDLSFRYVTGLAEGAGTARLDDGLGNVSEGPAEYRARFGAASAYVGRYFPLVGGAHHSFGLHLAAGGAYVQAEVQRIRFGDQSFGVSDRGTAFVPAVRGGIRGMVEIETGWWMFFFVGGEYHLDTGAGAAVAVGLSRGFP